MKYLLLILSMSILLPGEMEVDGNLTVTDTLIVNNRDVITTIDSLHGQINSLLILISSLEMRIAQLECQNTGIIPDGYCDCFFHTLDECGVCNGDTASCQDCAGVPNGDNLQDMCGICDADSSNDCVQDCFGEWGGTAEYDACGECGGTCDTWCGCDGICEAVEDVCGVCGGEAESEDDCNYGLYFDGNDFVDLGISNDFCLDSDFTIIFRAIVENETFGRILGYSGYNHGIGIGHEQPHWGDGDRINYYAEGNDYSSSSINTEYNIRTSLHYYILRKQDGTVHFSIDGESLGARDNTDTFCDDNTSLVIGKRANNEFLKGTLDYIYIFDKSLNENEISNYMFSGLSGDAEGLVGYWNFNENGGDTIIDQSSNQNDGVINGNPYWIQIYD